MNNFFEKIYGKNRKVSLYLLFVFTVLTNSSTFAQNTVVSVTTENFEEINTIAAGDTVSIAPATSNSNVHFILWFMGTKEDPNKTISSDGMYTKKQIIISGTVPNHLLIKTLLKKTINIKFC
ncbi:hypothetical protein [Flavobacterium sp. N3904]|uniref:hypothetical protein n=1 Tax=Flavobacterium sp. N3904 TaxID=2986835 RepID=UPI002224A562|nr:hypothetical protein [Flavobacterium sp. N3904]